MDQSLESPSNVDPEVETALRHKRVAIDREIEAFRASKDAEFREYEVQVRGRRASNSSTSARRDSGGSNAAIGAPPCAQRMSAAGPAPAVSGQRRARKGRSPGSGSRKADERELRALFAPYVALMDKPRASDVAVVSPASEEPPPRSAPRITRKDPIPTSPAPSTSFDPFGSTGFTASPQPRRASSSPIASTVLRSSLRQPTSPPGSVRGSSSSMERSGSSGGRSKHVLFAIDNVVLSPSSSPLAKRDGGAVGHRPPTPVGPPKEGSKGGLGETRGQEAHGESANGDEEELNTTSGAKAVPRSQEKKKDDMEADEDDAIIIPRVSPARIPRPPSLLASPPRRSYKDLLELKSSGNDGGSVGSGAPGGPEVDEFPAGMGDEDPLFAFDDGGEADWVDEEGSGAVEALKEDDEGKGRKEETLEESPMAGSLPIEIKWPGKRT